ncbi:PucR family transcriptional regulator [Desulfitobacterium sp. Sab5]|uniref:PucR family transcriptional regulator n=1 Tax=Desulfitobacterium nosdiversum TaxID=3375356 RepID=UPI003CF62002
MNNPTDSFVNKLIQSLAQGKDIPFLAWQLAQNLNRPVIITNAVHRIIAFQDPSGFNIKVGEFFSVSSAKVDEDEFFNGCCNLLCKGQCNIDGQLLAYTYLPLQTGGCCLGYCIVLNAINSVIGSSCDYLDEKDKQYITQASMVILLALRSVREFHVKQEMFQDEFIRDVLYNNYDSKVSIFEKAKLWNWDLKGPLLVMVIEISADKLATARNLIPRLFNRQIPISAGINDQLILILKADNLEKTKLKIILQKFIDEFLSKLLNYGVSHPGAGVGSVVAAVTDLYKSYQEAKVALELGKVFGRRPVCYFEEMGFLKFIFTQPALELQEFSERIIGPLLKFDLETEADLLNSLRVYMDCKCQITECAKALYIHENTLRNRIKKIEQLTGFDLRRVDHLVNVYIALQVLTLGQNS